MINAKVFSVKNGFSLVEVLVAFGLLSILGLSAAGLLQMMTKQQSSIQDKSTSGEIIASLSQYLLSDLACSNEYIGKIIPAIGQTAPFTVQNFKGLGTASTLSTGGLIHEATGKPFNILKLNISTPAGQVFKPTSGNLFYAQVEIQIQLGKNNMTFAPRTFSIPVLVDSASQITKCQLAIGSDQFCAGIGGVFNALTGRCDFISQCVHLGTFIAFSQAGESPAFTGPRAPLTSINNPMTGTPSCPAGSNRTLQLSSNSWPGAYYISFGKKGGYTYHATMTETYYLCQKCP